MKVRSYHGWVSSILVPLAVVSCVTTTPTDDSEGPVGEVHQALVTDCAYLDPSIFTPLPVPVDFEKELTITDISVVEDPCRTTWSPTGGCASGTVGAWTFATLMTRMAGTTPPEQFAAEWLDTFETAQTVNGFPVPPRNDFRATVLDPWLVASGCPAGSPIVGPGACTLDLKIAPFRLLAIVNRIDLQGFTYGGDSPGEARFVFGWLNLPNVKGGKKPPAPAGDDAAAAELAVAEAAAEDYEPIDPPPPSELFDDNGQLIGNALKATVIFEYKLPPNHDFCEWGQLWHQLSNLPFGSKYNNVLQDITDGFTSAGLDPAAPNLGVSIGQVRTNDISLGGDDWVLREYQLQDVGRGFDGFALANAPTAQTPDDSMNNHPDLNAWTLANAADIDATTHSVPVIDPSSGTPLLGGQSTESFFIWEDGNTPPLGFSERYHFGFSTCNDCHTAATNTGFTHISERSIGGTAGLSTFLSQSTLPSTASPGLPQFTQTVTDPFPPSGMSFEFNEPWRRVCEVNRVLRCEPKPYTRSNGGVH